MRLIDADALMELVEKTHCTGCNSYNKVRCRACPTGDMLDYLDDAPTVNEWHYPSRGELPDKGNEVWDGYEIIYYLPDLKKWYRFDDDEPIEAPYVWCYLPDPPKEEG